MSISGVTPTAAFTPVAVKPAQPVTNSATSKDDSGNNITVNAYNAVALNQADISGLLVANEFDVSVTGSNNNITVNEYNLITLGDSNSPSIAPSQNPDGTITLNGAAPDAIDSYVAQQLLAASDAYKKAQRDQLVTGKSMLDVTV